MILERIKLMALVITLSSAGSASGDDTILESAKGPETSAPQSISCEAARFVSLINEYRRLQGIAAPLKVSVAITRAAQWHAEDMASQEYFDHQSLDGRSPFKRMRDFGYDRKTAMSENIAAGNESADDTFCQWKNSPPHDQSMRNPDYVVMGIGRAERPKSRYRVYWNTGFGGEVDKTYSEPLTEDTGCSLPYALPDC